jgi:GAF domain-containing protein
VRAERPDLATVDDPQRLATLRASNLLDSPRSEDFDRITRMAADAVDVPVVLVTLVDAERQFFLSSVGLGPAFEERRETPLSVSLCQYVVAGDDALVIEDTRTVRWLRDKAAVEDFGVLAYAGFPLHAGNGHPIGSFSAIDTSPREWSQRELDLMRDFAAIVQAELDLRAARDDARRSSALLARLQSLTDATGSAGELDALLEDVVSACVEVFSADLAIIDLVDGNGRLLRRAARGLAAERPRDALRFGDGFAGRVGTLEQTVSVYDLQAFESADGLRAAGARSLLAAPLIVDGRVRGAVYIGAEQAGAYGEADRELLAVAADRFAAAIARVGEHERNRLVAQTLVSALQPARLPSVKGVRLAARYLPAERGLGGDWYDVFRLPGGALGLAIGDVVGHGIEAAAEAVRLRNALRGAVLEGHAPPDAVAALNRHASLHPGAYASTVVYLELDAATRRLRWSSAGHLPGVVASRGRGEWLGIADGPPLGVSDADAWPGAERVLEPGSRVVLFTDGLIERRAEPLDAGIDRVAAVAASAPDVERLCETTLVQAPAPRVDDLALIALELD